MKVLLIYPVYPDTFWSFKHILPFISRKAAFPPLGLLTVAAMLPTQWEKRLVDVNVAPLRDEDLAWADMVFISAMLVQEAGARDVIARARNMGKRIVAGGPAFTAQPERFRGVDHFVLNEAEITLPPFLDDLARGTPKPVYASSERPDISRTPLPQWDLIDFRDYVTMSVQYSRGCPFDCEFCDIVVMNGRRPRVKPVEQMLRELESLHDAGWRGPVFIVDDNFIGNVASVKQFLPRLIDWQTRHGYPFKFMTEASINLARDGELVRMMSNANFHKVFIGIETPSTDSLEECGKKQNVSMDFPEAIKTLHQNGLQVMGGFIVGFDSDTEGIFEQQIRFIQKIGVVTAMVGILTAMPQTRLWRRLKAENRLLGDATGENTDASLNFIPAMNREALINGYKRLLATLYSPEYYYARINTFLKNYTPTARGRLARSDFRAFLNSLWRIGILSRARFDYWKLLAKTALTKRKALPVAVELAILGRHFQLVAKRALSAMDAWADAPEGDPSQTG
ncbi:B12-binding domain-containing radical SAM protein [Solidesulfovibrio sp.]|uniref:B12-binding domain-containing radical SAM protein n=1 Tax=Solidesulfovibrio sp. TaxID=2910990 RepID=UPI00260CDD9A|nr:B12-binding domain-containing radical SAM protein [Solidesulfovibrio sp.]